MHIEMHICTYLHIYTHTMPEIVVLWAHPYKHTTHIYTHMHTYTHIHIYTYTHIHITHTYTHTHIHTYTYIHTHIHIHTYTRTHIQTHTHIHYTHISTDIHAYNTLDRRFLSSSFRFPAICISSLSLTNSPRSAVLSNILPWNEHKVSRSWVWHSFTRTCMSLSRAIRACHSANASSSSPCSAAQRSWISSTWCVYMCMYVCMYVDVCVYECMHVYMYVNTRTQYTYTLAWWLELRIVRTIHTYIHTHIYIHTRVHL